MAHIVAGFGMDALTIEGQRCSSKIEGKAPKGDDEVNYLQRYSRKKLC